MVWSYHFILSTVNKHKGISWYYFVFWSDKKYAKKKKEKDKDSKQWKLIEEGDASGEGKVLVEKMVFITMVHNGYHYCCISVMTAMVKWYWFIKY